ADDVAQIRGVHVGDGAVRVDPGAADEVPVHTARGRRHGAHHIDAACPLAWRTRVLRSGTRVSSGPVSASSERMDGVDRALGVLDGADVVYVDKLEPSGPIALTSKIGGRNPAHATAVGKALLAWTYPTDKALAAWIRRSAPLDARTPRTIVDTPSLIREIQR